MLHKLLEKKQWQKCHKLLGGKTAVKVLHKMLERKQWQKCHKLLEKSSIKSVAYTVGQKTMAKVSQIVGRENNSNSVA